MGRCDPGEMEEGPVFPREMKGKRQVSLRRTSSCVLASA